MSVAVSNSPVFSPSHHTHHYTLSPRMCPSGPFKKPDPTGSGLGLGLSKRKRPTRLDIPSMCVGFGSGSGSGSGSGMGLTPRVEVCEDVEEEEKDGVYSVCCKKGRRAFLEDRFSVNVEGEQAIFGVFDGHGGAKAAEYAADKLNKNIMAKIGKKSDNVDVKEAVKQGYLKTDSDFLEGELHGGSCCVTAVITNGDLIVSNAGDCRAVMSRGGVAEALTADHRPSRPDEKARIEAKGGYIDSFNGVWRIQGSLAVSRAIGDRQLKQWVIAEPETRVVNISRNDEFLILASDGLWDKVTNQEAVDTAHPFCTDSKPSPQPLAACKKLVDMAVSRGSLDDISVMIIPLEQYIQ